MTTDQSSPLFALDIGTRSVVGLLLRPENGSFSLIDSVIKEHEERAMLDGQIHDVPAVAKVIETVKHKLEEQHGPLRKVCVAAAGRSLKTKRARFEIDISAKPMFDRDDVLHLELSAVQQAQFQLANEIDDASTIDYYCVGYSVLAYSLDNEPIGSLLDQTGKLAAVEVIATFLPKVVVESLLAALTRAELELEALTLEPIAAINVLIPPSMRRLNVALVDIGAGTSDIALTDENTVIAYGMVPVAGDEITEAISDHYLLDFPDAEQVKRQLSTQETVEITDILGTEMSYAKKEFIAPIEGNIQHLARSISEEIIRLNGRTPKAVMLVGGGSLTPLLPYYVAEYLGLPENRVAIRGADAIKALQSKPGDPFGPELVTPIGIAIAAKENPIQYSSVTVNGRTLRLFDVKKLTIGDGLLAAGIDIARLYGKPGLALMVTVQEQLISIPGEYGGPPLLLKNGQPTTLDSPLEAGDQIVVERGQNGEQAKATIADLLEDIPTLSLVINGEKREITATILQNGVVASKDSFVKERDQITLLSKRTVKEILQLENIGPHNFEPVTIIVNGERWSFQPKQTKLLLNGRPVLPGHEVKSGDEISWEVASENQLTVATFLRQNEVEPEKSITVFYNNDPVEIYKTVVEVKRGDSVLSPSDELRANDQLQLSFKKEEPFILQDIFTAVEIDLAHLSGKKVVLRKNGEETSFNSPLINGDRIELLVGEKLSLFRSS